MAEESNEEELSREYNNAVLRERQQRERIRNGANSANKENKDEEKIPGGNFLKNSILKKMGLSGGFSARTIITALFGSEALVMTSLVVVTLLGIGVFALVLVSQACTFMSWAPEAIKPSSCKSTTTSSSTTSSSTTTGSTSSSSGQ